MPTNTLPFLSLIIMIPLAGSIIGALLPRTADKLIKTWAALVTFLPIPLAVMMWNQYGSAPTDAFGMKFVENYDWIPAFKVSYYLGVDGASFPLVALTALLTFLAVLASWNITNRSKEYFALLMLLEVGMMGVFAALDYVLFYVFWEIVLLPMYFLIGIWGGARREYAAIKFFIYTLIGSVVMLVGILALYFGTGAKTFNIMSIAQMAPTMISTTVQWWIFLALFFGFAIKVPVFPFHTWLPDAHVEAPTAVSMILAGVLLKMGTYAMVRISHPTLPAAAQAFTTTLLVLALINIVYGALAAMAQKDLKRMVAYSSVNHMGYFLLGLAAGTPEALSGALYVNISHGLISGLFFFCVGMMYDRTHTRELARLGGMWITLPVISTALAFVAFANLGLPGLAGFIAEFFVFVGAYPVFKLLVLVAGVGLVITAAFHLIMLRQVLMGNEMEEWKGLPDITGREAAIFAPLMVLIVFFGVYPGPLFNLFNPAATALSKLLGGL